MIPTTMNNKWEIINIFELLRISGLSESMLIGMRNLTSIIGFLKFEILKSFPLTNIQKTEIYAMTSIQRKYELPDLLNQFSTHWIQQKGVIMNKFLKPWHIIHHKHHRTKKMIFFSLCVEPSSLMCLQTDHPKGGLKKGLSRT